MFFPGRGRLPGWLARAWLTVNGWICLRALHEPVSEFGHLDWSSQTPFTLTSESNSLKMLKKTLHFGVGNLSWVLPTFAFVLD